MALNQVTFNKGQGGLGRPLQGEDYISGMVFYRDTLPSGFSTSDNIKQVFSLEEAESLGITEDSTAAAIIWYHVREFFKQNERAELWIGLFPTVTGGYSYTEIETLQNEASGKIRQVGVFQDAVAYDDADVATLDGIADNLFNDFQPLHIIFTPDISAETDLTALADLRSKEAKYVSVDIAQDNGNDGAALFASESVSIGSMGALLGAISRAKVSESIAWVDKFKINTGEFDTIGFSNGDDYKSKALSELDAIDALGYIFLRKYVGLDGSYYNDSHTAVTESDDFAYIENNRTIDKAVREIRTLLLPTLNGEIFLNDDGTLQEDSIQYYRSRAVRALDFMQRRGEISAFEVVIDPSQDVLATSKIVVTVNIVPVGVARSIEVNIGFTTSL